jgi:hypothetical protein
MDKQLEIYKMSEDIPRKVSDNYGFPENQLLGAVQRNEIAEVLIDKGYCKPPVQLGDTVYAVFMDICGSGDSKIEPYEVRYIAYDGKKWFVAGEDMELFEVGSKGAFLTKEAAERYLQENDKSDSQTSGKVKKPYESPRVEIIEKPNIFASVCPREEDL